MLLLGPTTCEWSKPKARRHHTAAVRSPSCTRIFIINALLGITAATMTTIALGSITTAMPAVTAAQSTNRPLHSQGNYQGVDAVSALTGLSNGYMQSYYDQQLRNAAEHQHQLQHHDHQHHHQQQQQHPHNTELVDKEPTGRGLHLHASHYGNGVGVGVGGVNVGAATSEALEIFNVPDSGFIPTTMSAAGQHYATSFLGFQALTDKNNAATAAAAAAAVNNKIDLQQSAPASYGSMAAALAAANSGAQSLYGRLSNYDELSGRSSSGSSGIASGGDVPGSGLHNFALAYDNYAANLYNDQSTNEGEQQQNFANYFTPTTSTASATAVPITASATTYGLPQSPHKYLPLNNYHNNEQEQHNHRHHQQHYQQSDKQHIYSRATSPATSTPSTSSATIFYENYNYPANHVDDNKQLVSSNYQTWNLVDKQLPDNYYASQEQQQPQQQFHQRHFKEDNDYKEPEMAESAFVVHTSGKRTKNKSKRSDPLYETYDSYSTPEHEHTTHHHHHNAAHDLETIHLQQHQLEELHKQLQAQQQQFVTLQHQLIDHDQQLQIQKHQPQYQVAQPTLPPVTHTIHHNPLSLHALSGTPLSKHTQIVRTIPVPQRQQVYVPTKQNVNVEVPDPIITTVSKPLPIEIPVSKTIAIPQIKEVKIPIERLKPFPVERPVPYIVEKRVPYTVEKQVAKPVYYHVPIKVPIVHTVVHKVRQPPPYSYAYQHQKQQASHPIHYTGHVRHPIHHGGYGHSHFGGGRYLK